ncbi:MAG TPA: ABC transporter substrate-binding protein [Aggregatilineales bacterium]|nr:ABC transporter substrate-binding protein [Aggregatilineales bacterium]
MKRLGSVVVVLVLLALVVMPVIAQEVPGPGEAPPVIIANLGSDIANLNPILIQDGSSQTVAAFLYPTLVPVNVFEAAFTTEPSVATSPGALAESWSISEDGLTYTFTLRELAWSDGTPITSADYKYAFDAIASGETSTALTYVMETIASVEAPEPNTLVINLNSVDCSALGNINAVPIVPSHVFSAQFPTFADMNEATDFNMNPTVTFGTFNFANFRPGEQVTLRANQDYPDTQLGAVLPEGWIFKNIADENLILEQFKAGEITLGTAPEDRQNELRELGAAGEAQVFDYPATSLRFISFNLADPTNPQNGLDENGEVIDQGAHPILGDVRVRQALMYATNWAELNEKALGNEGIQLASPVLPTSWAFDAELAPYPFDLAMADQLLTEAGWVDDDNDPATPRVAQGAMYAEDGTPLAFKLETNAGNTGSESIGVLLQDQWAAAGVQLDFQTVDFNVLVESLTGQTYDSIMLFWGYSVPDNPNDLRANYDPTNDVVGAGFNVSSYNNAEVNALMDEAKTMPGCDQEARIDLYKQVQALLKNDVPWFWVNSSIVTVAAPADLANWNPTIASRQWNVDAWYPAAR